MRSGSVNPRAISMPRFRFSVPLRIHILVVSDWVLQSGDALHLHLMRAVTHFVAIGGRGSP